MMAWSTYIISVRPSAFWYRHVDHAIIIVLAAINNFWPTPCCHSIAVCSHCGWLLCPAMLTLQALLLCCPRC